VEENLWIYIAALNSGYLSLADFVAWADQQVLQMDTPPDWLLEICLAKTEQEALGAFWTEWSRYVETVGQEWPDPAIHDDLYMGFLRLRFERGDITMAELLELAGRYSDAREYRICCETFYYMLNEIDGGGPTIPSNEPLEDRAARLFAPMAAMARQVEKLTATAL
jgi:hypothetical protein